MGSSRVEDILQAGLDGTELPTAVSRVEILLKEWIEQGGNIDDILVAGSNITLTKNDDGTITIAASGEVSSEDTVAREAIQTLSESLGDLAEKDSASSTYSPAGTVSQPTFTGSQTTVIITTEANNAGNYTPEGTVSQPTFTGSSSNVTVTTEDSINGNYTPKGTVSQPTFTGSSMTSTGSYTPEGSVSDVELNTTTFKPMTSQGTLPSLTSSVSNETLSFSWSAGTLPGIGSDTTCATTVKTQPSFSGTAATLSVSGTPTGTVSQPSFTGTKAQISGTVTPAGTVSQPTFSGTKVKITGTNTATGTVSQPTFSGTEATITVS